MQDVIRVTFTILCYNYGRYLRRAIESCLIQRAAGVWAEVLVLDDGSTDDTSLVCAKYKERIRVSKSEHLGLGATLTRAVEEARGEWIFFLDADDFFAPTKLAAFLPHLRSGVPFVNDLSCPTNEKGRPLRNGTLRGGLTSTLAVSRQMALDLLPVESELYFQVLARLGEKAELGQAHTFHRIHDANMTHQRSPGVWNSYLASITHRLADRLEVMSEKPPVWLKPKSGHLLAWHYREQAWCLELQAALECRLFGRGWGRWFRMISAANRNGSGIKKIHWRMLVNLLLMRSDFSE